MSMKQIFTLIAEALGFFAVITLILYFYVVTP